jgi:hypothetical protein
VKIALWMLFVALQSASDEPKLDVLVWQPELRADALPGVTPITAMTVAAAAAASLHKRTM